LQSPYEKQKAVTKTARSTAEQQTIYRHIARTLARDVCISKLVSTMEFPEPMPGAMLPPNIDLTAPF
jgi:hypothetical protein